MKIRAFGRAGLKVDIGGLTSSRGVVLGLHDESYFRQNVEHLSRPPLLGVVRYYTANTHSGLVGVGIKGGVLRGGKCMRNCSRGL